MKLAQKSTGFSHESEQALNNQIEQEAAASALYLSFAIWTEREGYQNIAKFFYKQSEEEREHMLKIINYLISVGGCPISPEVKAVKGEFKNVREVFEQFLAHEKKVTQSIFAIYKLAQDVNDLFMVEFLQWFISEQREEEETAMRVVGLLDAIGDTGRDLWFVDQEIGKMNG